MSGRRAKGQLQIRTGPRGISYRARFRVNGERRFQTLGHSDHGYGRKQAEEALELILAQIHAGVWADPRDAQPEPENCPSLHAFSSQWFADRKALGGMRGGLAQSTVLGLEIILVRHLIPFFARTDARGRLRSMRLDEIRAEDVDAFLRAEVESGLARSTAKKSAQVLSAILDIAEEYEYVQRNVARGPLKRFRTGKPTTTALSSESQITALLDAGSALDAQPTRPTDHHRAFIATLVFAGLRIGEALALQWKDIDLASGSITVRASKTDAGLREVDLLAPLRDELAALKARRDPERAALVFPNQAGKPQSRQNARRRWFLPAVEWANERLIEIDEDPLPDPLTPHSLRRTFASILVATGEDPGHVMDQMGHADAKFTLGVYRKAMKRRDGEKDRLASLVRGEELERGTQRASATRW